MGSEDPTKVEKAVKIRCESWDTRPNVVRMLSVKPVSTDSIGTVMAAQPEEVLPRFYMDKSGACKIRTYRVTGAGKYYMFSWDPKKSKFTGSLVKG